MKLNLLITFSFILFTANSFGFTVTPVIRASGQTLFVGCDSQKETTCTSICGNSSYCEIKESFCRNCAGTQNLKLKRTFDSIGTSLIALGEAQPILPLVKILKDGNFATLHPMSFYNYSSQYDGEQVRSQFKFLCPNLDLLSEKTGILFLALDPLTKTPTGVFGAVCPDHQSNQASFYKTNSRWQLLK